jgi:hypothetical protein
MAKYLDILMDNDDLALDADAQAVIISDRDVILQDMVHAIRESGILVRLVAERSAKRRELLRIELQLLAETDTRLIPGTVIVTEETGETRNTMRLLVEATTYDFGKISTGINYGS